MRIADPGGGPVCYMEPAKAEAAPLVVQPDSRKQVTFFLGRSNAVYEFFSDDRAEVLNEIRHVVDAVLEGRYEERVKKRSDGLYKSVGTLGTRPQAVTFTYNVWSAKRARGPGWQHWTYEPY